jgi:alpha-L-fucosidase 2
LEALRVLEVTDEQEERYRQLLAALPNYQTNAEGGLREWMHPDLPDKQTHVHMSHLYGMFPGWEINPGRHTGNPRLGRARSGTAPERAGQYGRMELSLHGEPWARSGQGERALENLELLLRGCTNPNLLSWGNDWRPGAVVLLGARSAAAVPDRGRYGLRSAVVNACRLASRLSTLLPALPATWPQGSVRGITTRCGVTVDLSWSQDGHVLQATLHSRVAQNVTLHLPDHFNSASQIIELTPGSLSLEFRV